MIDENALAKLPTEKHRQEFRKRVRDYGPPKQYQHELVRKILEKGIGWRGVSDLLYRYERTRRQKIKEAKMSDIERLALDFEKIDKRAHALDRAVVDFNVKLIALDVKEIPGIDTLFLLSVLRSLGRSLQELYSYFPIPCREPENKLVDMAEAEK